MNGVIDDAGEGNCASNDRWEPSPWMEFLSMVTDGTAPYPELELIFIHGLMSNYHSNYLVRTEDKITL
jgi:hypothetical protein